MIVLCAPFVAFRIIAAIQCVYFTRGIEMLLLIRLIYDNKREDFKIR